MKKILIATEMRRITIILLSILCLVFVTGCTKESVKEEDLVKYGTEYADYAYPAEEIAWELVGIAQEEYELYDAELNIQAYEGNPILELEEELDVYGLSCYPIADFYGNQLLVNKYIEIGWGLETEELRRVLVSFKDDYIDDDLLIYNIFHNSGIEGLGEVYDKLGEAETVEVDGLEIRIIDNVVALSYGNGFYNILFLPHSVYVENETLYYITGEEVNIDISWLWP